MYFVSYILGFTVGISHKGGLRGLWMLENFLLVGIFGIVSERERETESDGENGMYRNFIDSNLGYILLGWLRKVECDERGT
jgi:hypothetical protein